MPGTLFERTVAHQAHRNPVGAKPLETQAGPDCQRDTATGHRRRGREAVFGGRQVERSTLAPTVASRSPEDLGIHRPRFSTPGDQVAVIAVVRKGEISLLEERECRDTGRFLTDVDMEVPDVAVTGQLDEFLLEPSCNDHSFQEHHQGFGFQVGKHRSVDPYRPCRVLRTAAMTSSVSGT